jgi:hypothetical protein
MLIIATALWVGWLKTTVRDDRQYSANEPGRALIPEKVR